MSRPLRLVHSGLNQRFLADGDTVYADLDGDGWIGRDDRYEGAGQPTLIAAANYYADCFDFPFPGAKGLDPEITSGGPLNAREHAAFTGGPRGVVVRRPDLVGHLDFFDRGSRDGMITLRENYLGWRDLGFRRLKSVVQALGAAVVFGRVADGFAIDIERILERRPRGGSGIYGPDGNVDQARLAELATMFGERDVLTHAEFTTALSARTELGQVPRRQFQSLIALTARANGARTITRSQFLGLFDNSLFWSVASMPRSSGSRSL